MQKYSPNMSKINQNIKAHKAAVLNYEKVRFFLNKHSTENLKELIKRDFSNLSEFVRQDTNCQSCPGLNLCPNIVAGYQPNLNLENKQITLNYTACTKLQAYAEEVKQKHLVTTIAQTPLDIKEARFEDFNPEKSSRELMMAVKDVFKITTIYTPNEFIKGVYLYGSYGVGKTYLLGALANEFAKKKKIASCIVYWADFLRELKGSFEDNSMNYKINQLRSYPLLIIDDIGSETVSPWARDEVLGTVLQYRMQNRLLTCFSSNYSLSELEQYYKDSSRGESVKAERLIQRISYLAKPMVIVGENMRV